MAKIIFDAHLDLGMNAMEWNRDLTRPIEEIREREKGMNDYPDRGKGTVSLPEMRKGGIGICVATTIAPYHQPGAEDNPFVHGWNSQEQAWAQTQAQLSWYKAMEKKGEMVQIKTLSDLQKHLQLWEQAVETAELPIGYILSLEGADSIVNMDYLEIAYENGLRALGPAHYGRGVYAFGTDSSGGIGEKGRRLLQKMEELGIILDATHLCDKSFWEALKQYQGPVWASHNNCRALVPHLRQFSDEQIKALIERNAVIGTVFDGTMLVPGWERGKSTPEEKGLRLTHVADQMDHVCQLAGDALHTALGTDLDGGFGKEQCPTDMETIADLNQIPELLKKRGYSDEDVDHIMYKNWVRFLEDAWNK